MTELTFSLLSLLINLSLEFKTRLCINNAGSADDKFSS